VFVCFCYVRAVFRQDANVTHSNIVVSGGSVFTLSDHVTVVTVVVV
jgi:hypothetical protein